MNKPIKPNITIPQSFAENGVKTDFDDTLLADGFDNLRPDVLAGDNLNKFIDDTYKGLNYGIAAADAINLINEGETLTVVDGELTSGAIGSGSYLGQTIFSLDPLNEDGLHIYDGALLPVGGVYDEFITKYITNLYANYPQRFCTEAEWQQSVTTYGVCGKYVYTEGVSVRLPKVTGIVEGTIDVNALGEITEAGLPNINASTTITETEGFGTIDVSGAFYVNTNIQKSKVPTAGSASGNALGFDASLSNSIYGNSDTVQPQTIKGYYYIVVATGTKTSADVEIDNIVTDLNGKADVDLSNANPSNSFKRNSVRWGKLDYSQKIEITMTPNAYTTYVAPQDGYIWGEKWVGATRQYITINDIQVDTYASSTTQSVGFGFELQEGDVFVIGNAGSFNDNVYCYFAPNKE